MVTCKRRQCQKECNEIFIPSVKEIQRKAGRRNQMWDQDRKMCPARFICVSVTQSRERRSLTPHHHAECSRTSKEQKQDKDSDGRGKKLLLDLQGRGVLVYLNFSKGRTLQWEICLDFLSYSPKQQDFGGGGNDIHLHPLASDSADAEWHCLDELMLQQSPSKMFYRSAKH